jgi:hypothetical protein
MGITTAGAGAAAAVAPLHIIITSILGTFIVNSVVHTLQHMTAPHAPAPTATPSATIPVLIH